MAENVELQPFSTQKEEKRITNDASITMEEKEKEKLKGTETGETETKQNNNVVIESNNAGNDLEVLTTDIGLFTKIYLLTWKNMKIQFLRRPTSQCCKILTPILIMLICVSLTGVAKEETFGKEYGAEFPFVLNDNTTINKHILSKDITNAYSWIGDIVCPYAGSQRQRERFENLPPGYLGIVTNSKTTITGNAMNHLQNLIKILNKNYGTNIVSIPSNACKVVASDTTKINFTTNSLLKYFETNKELNNYVTSSRYADAGYNLENTANSLRPIGAAIVFDEISDDGKKWKYTFRFNATVIPSTDVIIDKFTRKYKDLFDESTGPYLFKSSFIQLQSWLDNGITEYIANVTNKPYLEEYSTKYLKGVFAFPSAPTTTNNYWAFIGPNFGLLSFIMICYPIITVVSILVTEKSRKIKEGMKMMGATTTAYWCSWLLWFFVEFTLETIVVTLLGTGGNVFRYSNGMIVFLWLWLFFLSNGALAILLSTLFDNPKTASLVAFVVFFASGMGGGFTSDLDEGDKTAVCLLATTCYTSSIGTLSQYEQALLGVQWDNIDEIYNKWRFKTCLIMMFVDTLLYLILALYLDQVWPSKYGQKQVPWFFLKPDFWKSCFFKPEPSEQSAIMHKMSAALNEENYEKTNFENKVPTIALRKLTKIFKSSSFFGDGAEVCAVNGISINMYTGEVFCLLGHNGAGKTTTISMLTGLLDPTKGTAWIFQQDISKDMNSIRKNLGVCPQHDVLWDRLTAEEHLWLFASLKGVSKLRVKDQTQQILADTGLEGDNCSKKFPTNMSGGQKRKLSLGIALIGGSQVVFLDEPTSGMDPQSRRITWDLIQKEKCRRSIILTTHFMDEADVLGDRIAIMNTGNIVCCGSSLYLKRLYGVGYTFTVSLEVGATLEKVKPEIDDIITKSIKAAENVESAGSELKYRLPFDQTSEFPKVFETLDNEKEKLAVSAYGISVTTLEEVFLKIGGDHQSNVNVETDDNNEAHETNSNMKIEFPQPTFQLKDRSPINIFFVHVYAILYKRFWWTLRDTKALFCQVMCPVILSALALGLISIRIAVEQPDILLSTSAWKGQKNYNFQVPINAFNSSQEALFGANNPVFWSNETAENDWVDTYDSALERNNGYLNQFTEPAVNIPSADTPNITHDFQDRLLEDYAEIFYNAFWFFPNRFHVYLGVNQSAYHSIPTTLNLFNNWMLVQHYSNDTSIQITNYPLPVTERQDLVSSQISGFISASYIAMAFSFIPGGAIYFLVNEKTTLTKHQQLVSGISFISYWVANYVADFFIGLPATFLVVIFVYIFDTEAFTGSGTGALILILMLFLFSVLPFTYLLSFLFSSPPKSQLMTILLYVILGMVLGIVSFVLDQQDSKHTRDTNDDLKPMYRIFPVFCLTESMFNVALKKLVFPTKDELHWDVTGRNLFLMFIQGIGYFGLVLVIEYLSTFPVLLGKLGFVVNAPMDPKFTDNNNLDEDVLKEKLRIQEILKKMDQEMNEEKKEDDSEESDTLLLGGLRKVYPRQNSNFLTNMINKDDHLGKKAAVRDLYFGVKQGEVFGFLGVNGAGKTTTLATLTGERYQSAGTAYINKISIADQLKVRRYVGYCPQFDAIFGLLTAREHLKFYGILKGLSGDELEQQIQVLLKALTLRKYENRISQTYSGGNKRKLSVAVSMIGNPPVVLLDEPSTGMDPVSRRQMWKFITATMKGRCVILTTHSMEECEALCHRVGIMVNGYLRCIGTAQHLKHRFGQGHELTIILNENYKDINKLTEILSYDFESRVLEHTGNKISFEIVSRNKELKLSELFGILEKIKHDSKGNIVSYALSQTSLEQIFIRMAQESATQK